MNLTQIENKLRQLADFIRDNPGKKLKIMNLCTDLFTRILRSADLKRPSLLSRKEMLEEQIILIQEKIVHFDNAIEQLGDSEADMALREGLLMLKNQHQGAIDSFNMEISKINIQLGI